MKNEDPLQIPHPKTNPDPDFMLEALLSNSLKVPGPNPSSCKIWKGSKKAAGYAGFCGLYVHRLVWELANKRTIPEGMYILHSRDCNKLCIEPEHLRLGTHQENLAEAGALGKMRGGKGRKQLGIAGARMIIRDHLRTGSSYTSLGRKYRVHANTVSYLLKGRTWRKKLYGHISKRKKSP